MAFAIKSYILVDIYCRNLPLQKLGGFKQNEDAQSDVRVWCISSSSIGSVYAIYLRRGLSVLLIRFVGSQGLEVG